MQPFSELLAEYVAASRRGESDTAAVLQHTLQDRCSEAVKFLATSAELDVQEGRHFNAATKWAAAATLRPADLGYVRQELNALTMEGDLDLGLRRLHEVGYYAGGFDHFYWSVNKLLQAGEVEAASQAVNKARTDHLFPEPDLAVAGAVVLLAMGLDLTADEELNRAGIGAGPNAAHWLRLRARLLIQRGRYDEAAEAMEATALATGNVGDLTNSVSLRETFLRYDAALDCLARFVEHWPAQKPAIEPLAARFSSLRDNALNAISLHGPLRPYNPTLILHRLREGQIASEILWARLALRSMVDSGDLPIGNAVDFLGPLPAWEDPYVNRFLVIAFLNAAPTDGNLQRRHIRSMALDPEQLEGVAHALLRLPVQEMDGDAIVYAIHVMRQISLGLPATMARLAEPRARLLALVSQALPNTALEFRVFAAAHTAALGLQTADFQQTGLPAEQRRALHQGAVFGSSPWTMGAPRKAVHSRRPIASVVVALSGQMRGLDRAWPSTVRHLIQPLDAPVVISFWDTSQNAMGRHAQRLERTLPHDLLAMIPPLERFTDIFQQRFPRSAEMVFGKIKVDPALIERRVQDAGIREYLIETESEVTYDRFLIHHPQLYTHSLLKMFAKFHRLDQMITDMERERGDTFTHVCWIRPDARLYRFSDTELRRWTKDFQHGWGHAVRPATVGDYILFLPRRAFSVLAKVFPAAIYSHGLEFFGWLPLPWNQLNRESVVWRLQGPESIAAALFSAGVMVRNMVSPRIELVGYMPPGDDFRQVFLDEYASK